MSYINETKKECNGNTNGFIYALVRVHKKDNCVDMISYSDDKEYYLNNDSVRYIGMTNNPISRFQNHRTTKGKKMGMVIFDSADFAHEGSAKESNAISKYCFAKGKGPKWQKGHNTWAGA
jgi:predicted GIY-YIG superfamily endonuclease